MLWRLRALWALLLIGLAWFLVTLTGRGGKSTRQKLAEVEKNLATAVTPRRKKRERLRRKDTEDQVTAAKALADADRAAEDAVDHVKRRQDIMADFLKGGGAILLAAILATGAVQAQAEDPQAGLVRPCGPDVDTGPLVVAVAEALPELEHVRARRIITTAMKLIAEYQGERADLCTEIKALREATAVLDRSARRRLDLIQLAELDAESYQKAYDRARKIAEDVSKARWNCTAGPGGSILVYGREEERGAAGITVGITCGLKLWPRH